MSIEQGNIRIGDKAPDFTCDSSQGEIKWHEYLGDSWGLLCSHPKDFTPVCTTEINRLAQLHKEWAKRNVKVAVVSVDSADDHKKWVPDIESYRGLGVKVNFPILGDESKNISKLYGMLDQTNIDKAGLPLTVRSVFVIKPDKSVALMIAYPASTGRNFDEIIRVIDSLQLTAKRKVTTPADWKKGEDVIISPSVDAAAATAAYGDDMIQHAIPSCKLRFVRDPSVKYGNEL